MGTFLRVGCHFDRQEETLDGLEACDRRSHHGLGVRPHGVLDAFRFLQSDASPQVGGKIWTCDDGLRFSCLRVCARVEIVARVRRFQSRAR